MSIRPLLFPLLAAYFFLVTLPAQAFNVPEKLVFEISWLGITAGTATQEIRDENGIRTITSIARSASWLSSMFPVEDRIETRLRIASGMVPGVPLSYRMKISEGKHQRDKETIFDHERGVAVYIDHRSDERLEIPIPPNIFDAYSCFYHVRSLTLEPDKSLFLTIFDGKEVHRVEVRVLRRETVKTALGNFRTIVVQPLLTSEGIFDGKGSVDIWLTDDERHLPVKMKTKVAVGSVTAALVGGNF
jgi:hypothetical protein